MMTCERESGKFNIVIIYDSIDRKLVDNKILPMLHKTGVDWQRTQHTESFASLINKCDKVLIIVSTEFLNSPCLTWETIVALEKFQSFNDESSIAVMVRGIKDIPFIPFLHKARHVKLDENRLERSLTLLAKQVKGLGRNQELQIVNGIAHGLVWSYYIGYLKTLLPGLRQQIRNCDWYKLNKRRMPVKFFILLPRSCICPASLSDTDSNIKFVGQLDRITKACGGNIKHHFRAPVYSLQDGAGERYYCVVHYAMALSTLHNMETSSVLNREERIAEWKKFQHSLQRLVNLPENREFSDLVQLVPYNDEVNNSAIRGPSVHLLKAVEQSLICQHSGVHWKKEQKLDIRGNSNVYDVCIYGSDDDISIVHRLKQFLTKNGFCVCMELGCDKINGFEDKFPVSHYFVFILSKNYMTKQFQKLNVLSEILSQVKPEACVIPLLVDVDLGQVPESLCWMTYVDMKKEREYEEVLLEILRGEGRRACGHVPAVGVSRGLAWRFFTSYLAVILSDIQDKLGSITEDGCSPDIRKMFGVVPKSCICWSRFGDEDQNSCIHYMDKVLISKTKDSATVLRRYHGNMYRVESETGKQYKIIGEYVSSVICLRAMHDLAILNQEELQRELQRFIDTTHAILERTYSKDIRNSWKFVFYDDSKETLSNALIREIEDELASGDEGNSVLMEKGDCSMDKLSPSFVNNLIDVCETDIIVNNFDETDIHSSNITKIHGNKKCENADMRGKQTETNGSSKMENKESTTTEIVHLNNDIELTSGDEDNSVLMEKGDCSMDRLLPFFVNNSIDVCETDVIVNNLDETDIHSSNSTKIHGNKKCENADMRGKQTETNGSSKMENKESTTTEIVHLNNDTFCTCDLNKINSVNESIKTEQQETEKELEKNSANYHVSHMRQSLPSSENSEHSTSGDFIAASKRACIVEHHHSLDSIVTCEGDVQNSENSLSKQESIWFSEDSLLTEKSPIRNPVHKTEVETKYYCKRSRYFSDDVDIAKSVDSNIMVMTVCEENNFFSPYKELIEKSESDISTTETGDNKVNEYTQTVDWLNDDRLLTESEENDDSDSEYFSALEN